MMISIQVSVCIWAGVMVFDIRDWISLKFIWHMTMTSNETQVEFQRGGYMPIWIGVS